VDQATPGIFERDLDKTAANYVPLSPVSFLRRAASVYPNRTAVIHGDLRYSYAEFLARVRRLASALKARGIGRGDTVAVFSPNIPALLEAHYAVPMLGAVLNALNTRLDARTVAFILEHGEAKAVLSELSLNSVMGEALEQMDSPPAHVIDIVDPMAPEEGPRLAAQDYETMLTAEGDPSFDGGAPPDEWDALALNYTSGTTGNPKGVVYHHRGAYLNALSNALTFQLTARSVYLWTLPMFHCNGWTYTWAVTAACGTHVCLRKVDPALIFPMIEQHGVTHMCGAPIVLTMLIHAPAEQKREFPQRVEICTGGAAPASATISRMEEMGFSVTHMYGMTECYGPSTVCAWQPEWDDMTLSERAPRMARQGVAMVGVEAQRVVDPQTFEDVPADGETIGMLVLRSNTVMRGYLKNPQATAETLREGWLNTGDLAVMHEDGYVEVKDRAKDIIISGGENISSLEVEDVLFRHPDIMEAAVVAAPHELWGETPIAYVTPAPGREGALDEASVIAYCKDNMARFKAPTKVVFGPLPKTATGKIQKFVLRSQAKEGAAV
jgi:fatty-acyl-CoA synthase